MKNTEIKEGSYYWTTCDCIYGLSRKTLIYVIKINKITFNYLIADWSMISDSPCWNINIHTHYPQKRRGWLKDNYCFSEYDKKYYTETIQK